MKAKTTLFTIGLIVLMILAAYATIFFTISRIETVAAKPIAIACVGDSITEWSEYPKDLQNILGKDYNVSNFGVAESAISTKWFKPYIKQREFQESMDSEPTIVVIMLGTNDAHLAQSTDSLFNDYEKLIADYEALPGEQEIILVKPPPIYNNSLELNGSSLQSKIIPVIEQVASNKSLPVLDVNAAMMNHPEYFPDGVHPNSDGALAIAREVGQAITFDDFNVGPPP